MYLLPYLAYAIGEVSIIGILANILVLPIIPLAMASGAFVSALSLVSASIAVPFSPLRVSAAAGDHLSRGNAFTCSVRFRYSSEHSRCGDAVCHGVDYLDRVRYVGSEGRVNRKAPNPLRRIRGGGLLLRVVVGECCLREEYVHILAVENGG